MKHLKKYESIGDKTTNLVIDLTWSENLDEGPGGMAIQEVFPITFYRLSSSMDSGQHTISSDNVESIIEFLTEYKIPHKYDGERFLRMDMEADIFLFPCHHIELRVRKF